MAGGAAPVPTSRACRPPCASRFDYLASIVPLRFVRQARPGALFFQAGRRDDVVPRPALAALIQAAPSTKRVRWYDAGHGLDARAYREQLAWLEQRLGLRTR